jgi:hypothetical protein
LQNLNSSKTSLVPAKYGDVIYSSTIPTKRLPQLSTEQLMAIGKEVDTFEE